MVACEWSNILEPWSSRGLIQRDLCISRRAFGHAFPGHESRKLIFIDRSPLSFQVVTQANTIANIQKQKAGRFTSAFKHDSLFDWIKSKNETPEAWVFFYYNYSNRWMANAWPLGSIVRRPPQACAGYCYATTPHSTVNTGMPSYGMSICSMNK